MEWARQVIAGMQHPEHIMAEEKVNSLWEAIEAGMEGPRPRSGARAREQCWKWSAWMLGLLGLAWLLVGKARRMRPRRQSRL